MKKKTLPKNKLDFVAIASHQLRTPLALMKGYLAMILGGEFGAIKEAKLKTAITAVYQANERLIRLVENLLNMTALEKGRLKVHREATDIHKLIRAIVTEMKPKAKTKNIKILFKPSAGKAILDIDPLLIRQVVLNLIDNAIKYISKGTITIQATLQKGKHVISVSDTGPGLEPKQLRNIFNKFERRDVKESSGEGFGLGLYVCALIIKAHGGTIKAQSRGKGFGFRVMCEI